MARRVVYKSPVRQLRSFRLPIAVRSSPDIEPSGAPAGQISASLVADMRSKIAAALETDKVVVHDVNGDGRHVAINVVSSLFEDKNEVQRQRLVYKAIWLELQDVVHAVDEIITKTPAEAGL